MTFAFFITTLFMAVIMLIYLGKGVYYLELDKIESIKSLAKLGQRFSKQTTTFDEFVSGIVSETNSTHINGNDSSYYLLNTVWNMPMVPARCMLTSKMVLPKLIT